jgi:competence protein CoiA
LGLYAFEEDELIHASFAKPETVYRCPDCFGPLKKRTGKIKLPHFYHIKTARACRLYSKTEYHLLAQIQLQKKFPEGTLELEKPFAEINRVADVCFEKEKLVFEIQCSPLTEKEAEMRIQDYRSIGYETVWLLDDRRYNKWSVRPAEEFLRQHNAYYISIREGLASKTYDQFEILSEGQRVKRSKQMEIDLKKIYRKTIRAWSEELYPKQIIQLNTTLYFQGDRLYRAMHDHSLAMLRWRTLEKHSLKTNRKATKLSTWFRNKIGKFYVILLEKLINKY